MNHLESLVAEYFEFLGYFVRRNFRVGRLKKGGWEMELDIVAYSPEINSLVHVEPSLDANSWDVREIRFKKKADSGRSHIFKSVFPFLDENKTELKQFAILPSHPEGRENVGGMTLMSIDEFIAEVKMRVLDRGPALKDAIPENFPMLRTLQLALSGYNKTLETNLTQEGSNFRVASQVTSNCNEILPSK